MSFGLFDFSSELDQIVASDQGAISTLETLRSKIGDAALPPFLIQYINMVSPAGAQSLAIHTSSSIASYGTSANQDTISRDKGFMGNPQLEPKKFPNAVHHIKIFRNVNGKAKVFYKYKGSLQFVQNIKNAAIAAAP
jgi:hypothetical protein